MSKSLDPNKIYAANPGEISREGRNIKIKAHFKSKSQ